MLAQSRSAFATSSGRATTCNSRRSLVCLAQQKTDAPSVTQRCATAMLSAAVATTMIMSAPAAMAIPEPEKKSFGAERTEKLINELGTPNAARPDTMKTNVPFQAPGISQSPRGKGQQEGTSPKDVYRNVKKVIKEQNSDPDSTPLGISKGPLVKQAKKMDQPGKLSNIKKETREAVGRAKEAAANTNVDLKRAANDPERSKKRGIINGSFTTIFGGRNQASAGN